MPPKRKRGAPKKVAAVDNDESGGTGPAKAEKENKVSRKDKLGSYIADLDSQTDAFMATLEEKLETCRTNTEREYRLIMLRLPTTIRHMNWIRFLQEGAASAEPKPGSSKTVDTLPKSSPVKRARHEQQKEQPQKQSEPEPATAEPPPPIAVTTASGNEDEDAESSWENADDSPEPTRKKESKRTTAYAAAAASADSDDAAARQSSIMLAPAPPGGGGMTRMSHSTTADVSVFSIPDSPGVKADPVPPVKTATKAKGGKRMTTTSKRSTTTGRKVMETPSLGGGRGLGRGMGAPAAVDLITPKVPVGQTPLNVCRAPRLNEVLWSAKGSPVVPSVIKKRGVLKSDQARNLLTSTSSNANNAASSATQLVGQLIDSLVDEDNNNNTTTKKTSKKSTKQSTASSHASSSTSSAVDDLTETLGNLPNFDAQNLGLLEKLTEKLNRIVNSQANKRNH